MTGIDLKHIRFRRYISQTDAADMVGISRCTLAGYESGRVRIPITVALRLNKLYNMTEDEINELIIR